MATPANASIDQVIATAFRKVRAIMQDNLTRNSVVLSAIKKAGGVRVEEGGYEIQENLLYGGNSTVKSYAGAEQWDVTPQEGISAAIYQWKQLVGTVTITGIQEFKNAGKSRIKSLLETKIKQLDIDFRQKVNAQLLLDGTGNGGKDLTGLDLFVEDGAAWSVVGGIDSNAFDFWRNQYINFTSAYDTSFGTKVAAQTSVEGLRAFRRMYNSCKKGIHKPNLILTSADVSEAYESIGEGEKGRIAMTSDPKMLDLGFDNVTFKRVPIVWDDDVVATDAFFLNTEHLHFVIGTGHNFTMTEFVRPEDQDAKVAGMILYGNFTCSRRDTQGRITNLAVEA